MTYSTHERNCQVVMTVVERRVPDKAEEQFLSFMNEKKVTNDTEQTASCASVLSPSSPLIALYCQDENSKWFTQAFRQSVGNWEALAVRFDQNPIFNYRCKYNVPLAWCHSFRQSVPLGPQNQPVAQGGYVCALLDNCCAGALNAASQGRFQTSLSVTTEFLEHCPHGDVYISARCTKLGGTIGFATAVMHSDPGFTSKPIAKMTQTAKMVSARVAEKSTQSAAESGAKSRL